MKKQSYEVIDKKLFIFRNASETYIQKVMPESWTEKGLFYVNCKNEKNYEQTIRNWKEVKRVI